ncbi:TlpA family protein disulfide reductase [Virgibacillus ndiopensis]|uniref:TlpA family protein disulfide reductase n=1 Tax=Virgibacillus ndiopensis TaxID=2004408 RepID=UPI000C080620|nr:redoxin domain-containing protein [Virgibacillus ndiopensis]
MVKRILGIAVIVGLAGAVIFNLVNLNKEKSAKKDETNVVNVSGDTGAEGSAIVPPGKSGIEPGNTAPDFQLKTLAGETIKLSDLRGKKVMVNFWATWCPPCKEEMPEIQRFYEKYKDEIKIIAVNTESNVGKVRKFVDEYGYSFSVLLDKDMSVSDNYMVSALPTTYFIGTDGKIQQQRKVGPMTYDYMVEMLHTLK